LIVRWALEIMSDIRDDRALRVIWPAAMTAAAVGAMNPIPLADYVYLTGIWVGMLGTLAGIYGAEFDLKAFRTAAMQILYSAGLYLVGIFAFVSAAKYTGVGTIGAIIVNAVLNFGFTAAVGKMYQQAWRENRDPDLEELRGLLINTAKDIRARLTKEERKRLVARYKKELAEGKSRKEALEAVLKEFFA
jgi:uncharacterized protein (DUF697 family)